MKWKFFQGNFISFDSLRMILYLLESSRHELWLSVIIAHDLQLKSWADKSLKILLFNATNLSPQGFAQLQLLFLEHSFRKTLLLQQQFWDKWPFHWQGSEGPAQTGKFENYHDKFCYVKLNFGKTEGGICRGICELLMCTTAMPVWYSWWKKAESVVMNLQYRHEATAHVARVISS